MSAPAVESGLPAELPNVANLGSGIFSIDGLINKSQITPKIPAPQAGQTTSNVQMGKTHGDEVENGTLVPAGLSATGAGESGYEAGDGSDAVNIIDAVHQ